MKFEILAGYFGQHVEVSIINKTHSGVLRQSEIDDTVVEVEPVSDHTRKRYGTSIIEAEFITAIRPIKPYIDEDDDCCDEAI